MDGGNGQCLQLHEATALAPVVLPWMCCVVVVIGLVIYYSCSANDRCLTSWTGTGDKCCQPTDISRTQQSRDDREDTGTVIGLKCSITSRSAPQPHEPRTSRTASGSIPLGQSVLECKKLCLNGARHSAGTLCNYSIQLPQRDGGPLTIWEKGCSGW